jgi:hypothetical protein
MSNIGYVPVTLPSRGLLYGTAIPDGIVAMRKPTVAEEVKIQASGDLANTYLAACVKLPNGFSPQKLTLADRMALLIALRVHTFGPEYTYNYHCHACESYQKAVCDLVADTETTIADDDLIEPVVVHLPDSDKRVGLRFLRGEDEAAIKRDNSREAGSGILTSMCLQLLTIDDEDVSDVKRRAANIKFVSSLTMLDKSVWDSALADKEAGAKMVVHPECKACGHTHDMGLPVSGDFFRPTRTRR